MTSRTIDIYCRACRNYLFSLQPDDRGGLRKDYYCNKNYCRQQATLDGLKDNKIIPVIWDEDN